MLLHRLKCNYYYLDTVHDTLSVTELLQCGAYLLIGVNEAGFQPPYILSTYGSSTTPWCFLFSFITYLLFSNYLQKVRNLQSSVEKLIRKVSKIIMLC